MLNSRNCSGSHQGTKTRRIDMSFSTLSEKEEGIARKIVDAAYTVHKMAPRYFVWVTDINKIR